FWPCSSLLRTLSVRVSSNIRHSKVTGRPNVVTWPPYRCATHLMPAQFHCRTCDESSQARVQISGKGDVKTPGDPGGSRGTARKARQNVKELPKVVAAYRRLGRQAPRIS